MDMSGTCLGHAWHMFVKILRHVASTTTTMILSGGVASHCGTGFRNPPRHRHPPGVGRRWDSPPPPHQREWDGHGIGFRPHPSGVGCTNLPFTIIEPAVYIIIYIKNVCKCMCTHTRAGNPLATPLATPW